MSRALRHRYGRSDSSLSDRSRARGIVSAASKKVKDRNTAEWLHTDREGTWEKSARDYLESTREQAEKLGLSETQVNDEIAGRLAYLALSAQISNQKKRKAKR
jgi:hypothetical protein